MAIKALPVVQPTWDKRSHDQVSISHASRRCSPAVLPPVRPSRLDCKLSEHCSASASSSGTKRRLSICDLQCDGNWRWQILYCQLWRCCAAYVCIAKADAAAGVVQLTAEILGRTEECQMECDSELSKVSNSTPKDVADELLDHANCGGTTKSSRWEPGKAPVLVSGAGHDALPMAEITKVTALCQCTRLPKSSPIPVHWAQHPPRNILPLHFSPLPFLLGVNILSCFPIMLGSAHAVRLLGCE